MTLNISPEEIVAKAEAGEAGLIGRHATWERVPLGDVANVVNGAPFPSREFNSSGVGLPLIRIRDVVRGYTETYFGGEFSREHLIYPGDLLVGMDGDFKSSIWSGPPGLLNQRVCKVEVRNPDLYDQKFLALVLQGYLDALWAETSSVTVKHLSSRSVQKIPLPLPPLAEQLRIVSALDDQLSRINFASRGLSRAFELIKVLEKSIRGYFLEVGFKFKAGKIGDLLAGVEAGKSFACEARPAGEGEWGVVKVSAMTWGEFREDENKALTVGREFDSRHEIRPGDILVSRANTRDYVGAPVLVGSVRKRLLLSDKSLRLIPKGGVDREWFVQLLASPRVREQISERATGTKDSMRNISQKSLMDVEVKIPEVSTQRELASKIQDGIQGVRRLQDAVLVAQARADHLRDSLMRRAFSGKLVPQNPSDEPASVLLERIRAERVAAPKAKRGRKAKTRSARTSSTNLVPISENPQPVSAGEQTALEF